MIKISHYEKLFIIGCIKRQKTKCKLPSNGDCFKVLIYNMRQNVI